MSQRNMPVHTFFGEYPDKTALLTGRIREKEMPDERKFLQKYDVIS
ncbi:MAG: hypothetical protein ISQ68_05510 [Luminiphilus sp.]|nr:hypothetical protein [Luminiphilus sp.]